MKEGFPVWHVFSAVLSAVPCQTADELKATQKAGVVLLLDVARVQAHTCPMQQITGAPSAL